MCTSTHQIAKTEEAKNGKKGKKNKKKYMEKKRDQIIIFKKIILFIVIFSMIHKTTMKKKTTHCIIVFNCMLICHVCVQTLYLYYISRHVKISLSNLSNAPNLYAYIHKLSPSLVNSWYHPIWHTLYIH